MNLAALSRAISPTLSDDGSDGSPALHEYGGDEVFAGGGEWLIFLFLFELLLCVDLRRGLDCFDLGGVVDDDLLSATSTDLRTLPSSS